MRRLLFSLIAIALCALAAAQRTRPMLERYYRFSLGAGPSAMLTAQGSDSAMLTSPTTGFSTQLTAGYEWDFPRCFIGAELRASYYRTGTKVLNEFSHIRTGYIDCAVGNDDLQVPVDYKYIYSHYREIQRQINAGLLLYVGGLIGQHGYIQGGISLDAICMGRHWSDMQLATRKVYTDLLLPEVEEASDIDANYALHRVVPQPSGRFGWGSRSETAPLRLTLSPMIEGGYRMSLPIRRRPSQIRIGLFADWSMPLLAETGNLRAEIIDYTLIESRRHESGLFPLPESRARLDRSLMTGSLLRTAHVRHSSLISITRPTVGIRATLLLRHSSRSACHCIP